VAIPHAGRKVSTSSEEWRHESEVADLAAMNPEKLKAMLDVVQGASDERIESHRGDAASADGAMRSEELPLAGEVNGGVCQSSERHGASDPLRRMINSAESDLILGPCEEAASDRASATRSGLPIPIRFSGGRCRRPVELQSCCGSSVSLDDASRQIVLVLRNPHQASDDIGDTRSLSLVERVGQGQSDFVPGCLKSRTCPSQLDRVRHR